MRTKLNCPATWPAWLRLPLPLLILLISLLAGCEGSDTQRQSYKDTQAFFPSEYVATSSFVRALDTPSPWVDSVFNTLTPDERIAQLMVVEAFSNKGPKYEADVMRLIQKYKVGGLIFFQGGPVRQARLTNRYQAASKVPLLISMDAETGVGMRLDSTVQYPFQQMLGAIEDNGLISKMGEEVAEEFKRLGMHVNFAPVADINNNTTNPVIGYRAFGEDKLDVTAKCLAYMRGMQSRGIIATAKHFPGHGDTNIDSHYDLPIINHSRHRLDSLELYPFKELIKHGIGGIMVAHMHIPNLDPTHNLPSTLSKPIVSGILRHQLNFNGLIFTDAMVMKGVTKYFPTGEAEARALVAGNDVLERMTSVPRAIQAIKKAIANGELKQAEIDRRCKRMLAAKQWVGLDKYKPVDLHNLYQDLNPAEADSTNKALAEASITLLRNRDRVIPVRQKQRLKVATVAIGARQKTVFQREVQKYNRHTSSFVISRRADEKEVRKLKRQLRRYDVVLVGLYGPGYIPSNKLDYSAEATELVRELATSDKTIITLFDNAYTLDQLEGIHKTRGLLLAYQRHAHAQQAAARLLFGKIPARGRLPVTVNKHFRYGDGISSDRALLASL